MRTLLMLVLSLFTTGVAHAQEPAPKPAPEPSTERPAPRAPDPVNVRYEIAIRDEGGPQPGTKVVSMLGVLGSVSSVRAQGMTAGRGSNPLNVDVMATQISDNKILSRITIEYVPQTPETDRLPPLSVRQSMNVWLDNGKPMVVSESTDPNSDRRLTVQVTATVLR